MSNVRDIINKLVGTSGLDLGGDPVVSDLFSFPINPHRKTTADAMAADTTANTAFWTNPYLYPVRLRRLIIVPRSTLTANDTNFATIQIKTDDGAAGTPAVAFSVATTLAASGGTGNWVAQVPFPYDLCPPLTTGTPSTGAVAAELDVVKNGSVWFAITKGGSGVVVPVSDYFVIAERL